MSATQPTRRPWHSGTDAIWADSAAAADVESAPSNGEIVAGHVQNTGFTSGRANWLFAAAAEWFQRMRDTLLPQHTDDGDHTAVVVVAGSADEASVLARAHAGDATATTKLALTNAAGSTTYWAVSQDLTAHSGYTRAPALHGGTATADAPLLYLRANDPGTADSLIKVENQSTGLVKLATEGHLSRSMLGAELRDHAYYRSVTLSTSGATTAITLSIPDGSLILGWAMSVTTALAGTDGTTITLSLTGGATDTLGTCGVTLNAKSSAAEALLPVSGSSANAQLVVSGGADNTPSAGAVQIVVWARVAVDFDDV